MTTIGHNSVQGNELKAHIEQIERLEEEKRGIGSDIKDVYTVLKSKGYDPKIVRRVIAYRKKDPEKRAEEEAMTDTYLHACGMI
ncbi:MULTISPECIES: DUF2312 domain-containing protein [Brucella]|uniref:DUF2312 domain-containing protein n=1 Tax=Brucella TaxID=234 RepID=UPI00159102C9|nr:MULTISPECIES: DUF2312 domain-containing protein [Brucella]